MTVFLMLTSLTPTMVFGSLGDVVNLTNSLRYSPTNSDSKELLKDELKVGNSKENDLIIELEDGRYIKYSDKKSAEREVIRNFLVEHGVDMSDSNAVSEALIANTDEIYRLQEESLKAVEEVNLPSKVIDATLDKSNIGSAEFGHSYDATTCKLRINQLTTIGGESYTGEFYVRFVDSTGKTSTPVKGQLGTDITFETTSEVSAELSKNADFSNSIRLALARESNIAWKIDAEKSSQVIGLSGSTETGFTLAYSITLVETNGSETRPYTGNPTLVLHKLSDENKVVLTLPLESLSGETTFSGLTIPDLEYTITDNGKTLARGPLSVGDYEISNLVETNVDTTQPTDRKMLEITPTIVNEEYVTDAVYVEIRQEDSIVKEMYMNIGDTYKDKYTEGQYTVTTYTDDSKMVILSKEDIDFKHALPDDLEIITMPEGVKSAMLPWQYGKNLAVQLRPKYKGFDQSLENFTYRITDFADDSIVTITCQESDKPYLDVKPGSEYKVEMLSSTKEVLMTYHFVAPYYTQIAYSVYLDYNDDKFTLKLRKNSEVSIKDALEKYQKMEVTFTNAQGDDILVIEGEEYVNMVASIDDDYDTVYLDLPTRGIKLNSGCEFHWYVYDKYGVMSLDGGLTMPQGSVGSSPVEHATMGKGEKNSVLSTEPAVEFPITDVVQPPVTTEDEDSTSDEDLIFVDETPYIKQDDEDEVAVFEIDEWDDILPPID